MFKFLFKKNSSLIILHALYFNYYLRVCALLYALLTFLFMHCAHIISEAVKDCKSCGDSSVVRSVQVPASHCTVPLPCLDWFAKVEEKLRDGTSNCG